MPRQRLAEALVLPLVEHSELGDISEGNSELTPEISPKPKQRSNAYNRKRVCTKPKLVMLSEADERRMLALAARWGVSGSGAIKRALQKAVEALGLEAGRT
jgi:hypothetical protein